MCQVFAVVLLALCPRIAAAVLRCCLMRSSVSAHTARRLHDKWRRPILQKLGDVSREEMSVGDQCLERHHRPKSITKIPITPTSLYFEW
jgi:hypothetical protein